MNCSACGAPNPDDAQKCGQCGHAFEKIRVAEPVGKLKTHAESREDDDEDPPYDHVDGGLRTLIPYKNPKALAGYYCGFFALIPILGLLLAPVAIILGCLGIRDARRNPEVRGMVHAIIGVVFGLLSLFCYVPLTIFVVVFGYYY